MYYAGSMGGTGPGGFVDLGARPRPRPAAGRLPRGPIFARLQRGLRTLGAVARDGALAAIKPDGVLGPRTVVAVNRALTRHIGAGQAPAAFRTGALTLAQVAANANTIIPVIEAEVSRRGARVAPPVAARPRPRPRPSAARPAMPRPPAPRPALPPMPGAEAMPAPEMPEPEAPAPVPEEEMAPAAEEEMPPAEEEAPSEEAPAEEEAPPAEGETSGYFGQATKTQKAAFGVTIGLLAVAVGVGVWNALR